MLILTFNFNSTISTQSRRNFRYFSDSLKVIDKPLKTVILYQPYKNIEFIWIDKVYQNATQNNYFWKNIVKLKNITSYKYAYGQTILPIKKISARHWILLKKCLKNRLEVHPILSNIQNGQNMRLTM